MKANRFNNIFIIILVTTVFTACNKKQNVKPNITTQWNNIQTWSFNGKMAINDGNNSGSGRITWQVNQETIKAQFKAPLGQGSWEITENPHSAKLTSSNHGESTADNASILINNELGWEFPWESLKLWVRGYQTNQTLNPHSSLPNTINDNGWTITYQKWMNTPLGMLPKKIKATKESYTVKLIIYKWYIN